MCPVLLVSEYSLLSTDDLCSDKGMLSIGNMNECKDAMIRLSISGELSEQSTSEFPKGCYQHTNEKVYFNSHSTGSREENSEPICQKG